MPRHIRQGIKQTVPESYFSHQMKQQKSNPSDKKNGTIGSPQGRKRNNSAPPFSICSVSHSRRWHLYFTVGLITAMFIKHDDPCFTNQQTKDSSTHEGNLHDPSPKFYQQFRATYRWFPHSILHPPNKLFYKHTYVYRCMCLNTKANITGGTNKHTPQQPNHSTLKKYIVLPCCQQRYI